jgi:leader peptidase (prepilin peptidase) / N-methyltransferase
MNIIIFFIFGLIIGSFLNAVVYRLQIAETLLGRSHCPKCKAKIRWYDNVPLLSFIILGTRCRDCKEKISWQYPVVELATGIMFALIGFFFFAPDDMRSWFETIYYLAIFSLLFIVFLYDFKFMEIPMIIIWIAVGVTIAYLLASDWYNFVPQIGILSSKTFSGILGGIIAFSFFFALSAGSKEKWMGMGDAYLALVVGMVAGWPNFILALLFSFTIGSIYSIILVVLKNKTLKSQVPFAPFLVVGLFLALILIKVFPELQYFVIF